MKRWIAIFVGIIVCVGIVNTFTGNSGNSRELQNQLNEITYQKELLNNKVNNLSNELQGKDTVINETKNEIEKLKEEKTILEKEKEELNKELEELKVSKANNTSKSSSSSSNNSSDSSSSSTSSQSIASTYIINTNTGKFHRSGCSSVSRMKESNKRTYSGSRDDLVSQGYSPCKNCNP